MSKIQSKRDSIGNEREKIEGVGNSIEGQRVRGRDKGDEKQSGEAVEKAYISGGRLVF